MENTRGSEWRIWDLHVHTPESIIQHYKVADGDTDVWETYIKDLENLPKNIKILGINDYFFLEGYKRLKEEKDRNGRLKNIELLLPVVEFRIDKFAGVDFKKMKRINFHVIFSDKITIETIQSQFLNTLEQSYTLEKDGSQWSRAITRDSVSELGKKIKESIPEDKRNSNSVSDLEAGFNNLNLSLKAIFDSLKKDCFSGKYLTAIGKTEWDCLSFTASMGEKKSVINTADIVFTAAESVDAFNKAKSSLKDNNVNDLLLDCSDAHYNSDSSEKERLGNCYTWIKADPTFEGLKQILYEPTERVKIQKDNPTFDFDKSPFTSIEIKNQVKLFAKDEKGNNIEDKDNIYFAKTTIPLNSGLISIIGGRGTGKSKLIDYISVGLGKQQKQKWIYSKSGDIIIKRKISLQESEKDYLLSDDNNIPFMYISQSEIKEIVENNTEFTNKIRTLIGIPSSYSISDEYMFEAKKNFNDYCNLIDTLFADKTSSEDKKYSLNLEIKKQEDFIANITSEENKTKLGEYKKSIEVLQTYNNYLMITEKLKNKIETSQNEINSSIKSLNDDLSNKIEDISIPMIDLHNIVNYINNNVLTKLNERITNQQKDINDTKNKFLHYTGDLSTLLDNVKNYQEALNELNNKKTKIENDENCLNDILKIKLKELSTKIEQDIKKYQSEIEEKWSNFSSGKEDYTEQQKQLLKQVLGNTNITEKISLRVTIDFNEDKFYNLILEPLDKRSWKKDYLKGKLQIDSFESYINFINNTFDINIFDGYVFETKYLLKILYLKYTNYITHRIEILVNNKPLKYLSVGQRGTVYLRLQLASNLFSETIIYDQPEDDLDNDFITNSLVDLFKEIKKFRQVIIVSHNANLVVNADSEQVIVANNNYGVLTYKSGALENTDINADICKILEGGKDAFEKREQKYGFK